MQRNVFLIYLLNGFWMLLILMPIIVPFFESRGLNLQEIYHLQAIFATVLLLFEVPSGYVSDLFGRKRTLIIASLLNGLAFTTFLFAGTFWEFVLAECILAVGASLFSGTDLSLLYDSLQSSSTTVSTGQAVGRKVFYQQLGETIGGLIGGWLIFFSLDAPLYAQVFVAWLPLLPALALEEPPRETLARTEHFRNFRYILSSVFGQSRLLTLVVLNMVFYSAATLIAVWAFQKYWERLGIPLIYFGYLWALSNLTVALIGRNAYRIERKIGSFYTLLLIGILPIAAYLGMAWISVASGALIVLLFQCVRGLNSVVLKDALNRRVDPAVRATANSLTSLGMRLIFVAISPLVGVSFNRYGWSQTFVFLALFYGFIFFVLLIPLLAQKGEFEIT